tara:strand:+ start:798 stop:1208 length:411 start_codon:yes stop_codon:yes gene_type:complete
MNFPKLNLENVVLVLLVVFVVGNFSVPADVSEFVNTLPGSTALLLAVVALLYYKPVVGVIALIAAFELLRRSGGFKTNIDFIPSEEKKSEDFNAMNDFPLTLEEEVVANMVPMSSENLQAPSYQPLLEDLHDSSQL